MYLNKFIIYKLSILVSLLSSAMYGENIPVINKDIKRGHIIQQGDIEYTSHAETNTQNIISSSETLIGSTATTDINANIPIIDIQIKTPNIIHRNAIVNVTYIYSNITLQTKALALQSAPYGQIIKLQNIDNKKNIWGLVKGKNKVLVTF